MQELWIQATTTLGFKDSFLHAIVVSTESHVLALRSRLNLAPGLITEGYGAVYKLW